MAAQSGSTESASKITVSLSDKEKALKKIAEICAKHTLPALNQVENNSPLNQSDEHPSSTTQKYTESQNKGNEIITTTIYMHEYLKGIMKKEKKQQNKEVNKEEKTCCPEIWSEITKNSYRCVCYTELVLILIDLIFWSAISFAAVYKPVQEKIVQINTEFFIHFKFFPGDPAALSIRIIWCFLIVFIALYIIVKLVKFAMIKQTVGKFEYNLKRIVKQFTFREREDRESGCSICCTNLCLCACEEFCCETKNIALHEIIYKFVRERYDFLQNEFSDLRNVASESEQDYQHLKQSVSNSKTLRCDIFENVKFAQFFGIVADVLRITDNVMLSVYAFLITDLETSLLVADIVSILANLLTLLRIKLHNFDLSTEVDMKFDIFDLLAKECEALESLIECLGIKSNNHVVSVELDNVDKTVMNELTEKIERFEFDEEVKTLITNIWQEKYGKKNFDFVITIV